MSTVERAHNEGLGAEPPVRWGSELTWFSVFKTLLFNAYATLLHEITHCLSSFFVLTFMHSQSESALAIAGQNLSIIQQLQLNFTIT